jgi:hypothetical protein
MALSLKQEEFAMTTATKTPIQVTWNVQKIQEEAVSSMTRNMMTTMSVMQKLGPEAQKQLGHAMVESKIEHFKKLGVKTPLELVKAMAEFEVNVFGSKIIVWGDEKEASLEYEYCACYNAMQKACNMNGKGQEEMGQCWAESMQATATAFGFSKGEVKFPTKPEEHAVITFIK